MGRGQLECLERKVDRAAGCRQQLRPALLVPETIPFDKTHQRICNSPHCEQPQPGAGCLLREVEEDARDGPGWIEMQVGDQSFREVLGIFMRKRGDAQPGQQHQAAFGSLEQRNRTQRNGQASG